MIRRPSSPRAQGVVIYPNTTIASNPYLETFTRGVSSAGYSTESWRWAFPTVNADIIVLHWIEHLWLPPQSLVEKTKRALQRFVFFCAVRRHRRNGGIVFFVAHNAKPHRWAGSLSSWSERTRSLWEVVDGVIHLTRASIRHEAFREIQHLTQVVIPHPHYDLIPGNEHAAQAAAIKRIALIGGLEPRKGAVDAAEVLLQVEGLRIFLSGGDNANIFARLTSESESGRLETRVGRLTNSELNQVFDGSTAALLNQNEALNSGVLFFALSRGAPVFAPRTPINEELQVEFGSGWIRLFTPPLNRDKVVRMLRRPVPAVLPDMSGRSAQRIGAAFHAAVRQVRFSPLRTR